MPTLDDIVLKIVEHYGLTADSSINIHWRGFMAIMASEPAPTYRAIKTIREKWVLLHALGYCTEVNQFVSRVNVAKIFGEVIPRVAPSLAQASQPKED